MNTRLGILVAATALAAAGMSAQGVGREDAARRLEVSHASLGSRASHNGTYQARLRPGPDGVHAGRAEGWTVEVRSAAGAPVEGGELVVQAWMPDADAEPGAPLPVTPLGAGRYRVDGVPLERPGLHNLKVRIRAGQGTDSLAFNLVLAPR